MFTFIPLYGRDGVRAYTLIDHDNFARFNQHRWWLHPGGYATRKSKAKGKRRTILMHREVLGLDFDDPLVTDHINGSKLDNRRSNLRAGTQGENLQNQDGLPNRTSRFRGVSWDREADKWMAHGQVNGHQRNLGRFIDEQEAANAAARFRSEHMPFSTE